MKKILFLLCLSMAFMSCGKSEKKSEKVLYIFNWSDYMPQEILDDFYKETGIKVIVDNYASNEEMYAKISSGSLGYDIVFPSADYQEIMINQKMLHKLDKSKIPNIKNLNKDIIDKIEYDKNLDYTIPYAIGATGIAVNKEHVKNYKKSYEIFENSNYKGYMTLLDDGREVITSALLYNGFDGRSTKKEELEKAKDSISKWKKNIVKFDSESFGKGLATGEFWVVQGYYENIVAQLDESNRDNFEFFIPEKGGTMYIDSMVILNSSKNTENAYKFIDFILRPEVYAKVVDFFEIPSVNTEAEKLRKTKSPYSIEDLKKTSLLRDLGSALEVHNGLWSQIKSEE
jgi:spermidine/putrescine transport system substrate-binding protein